MNPAGFLGFPNCVFDLERGIPLPPDSGLGKFITQCAPYPYERDARHPLIDGLFEDQPKPVAQRFCQEVARALYGSPRKGMVNVIGSANGGRLLWRTPLPPRSARTMSTSPTLWSSNKGIPGPSRPHTDGLVALTTARVAFLVEKPGLRLDTEFLKKITGLDRIYIRRMYERSQGFRSVTASLFTISNSPLRLDYSSEAMQVRLRPIEWAPLKFRNPDYDSIGSNEGAMQALAALILRHAPGSMTMPDETAEMRAFRSALVASQLSPIDRFSSERIEMMPSDNHRVLISTLWDAFCGQASDDAELEDDGGGATRLRDGTPEVR